jgi:hypothetical protein
MKNGDDREQLGVSRLPMPPSDSPLVIDLPDGQKLVLGNMATGNVIEVATWRGTGRPDSRTSRLMLGMSTAESVAAQAESEKTNQLATPNKFAKLEPLITTFRKITTKSLPYLQRILGRIAKQIQALPLGRLTDLARGIPMPKMINSASQQVEISGDSDKEISDWLDSIVSKSKSKAAATVQNQTPLLNLGVKKVSASKPVTSKAAGTTKKASKKRPAPPRKSRH